MFQFTGFPPYNYQGLSSLLHCTVTGPYPAGSPHSDIRGSLLICSSPRLFAAYHVFLRLLVPRHPPCALLRLTSPFTSSVMLLGPSLTSFLSGSSAGGLTLLLFLGCLVISRFANFDTLRSFQYSVFKVQCTDKFDRALKACFHKHWQS